MSKAKFWMAGENARSARFPAKFRPFEKHDIYHIFAL
jgi:hypothetical protein